MSRREVSSLIEEITKNQKFISEVRKCVNELKQQTQDNGELPTFAFQKAAKYPWSLTDNNLPVEGQKMIEQITEMMASLIDNNLHHILNKEFLNISNEILTIRDQITEFVQDQDKKIIKMKDQFNQNLQSFRKKMVIQQNSGNNGKQPLQFSRTRVNATLNSTNSSRYSQAESKESKGQIETIKKDIETIKLQIQKLQTSSLMSEKLIYLEQKIQNQIMNLRVKIQGSKAKTDKSILDLSQKVSQNSSKDFIASEVKRAVKSHIKVYLQQITICKQDRMRLHDLITKTDKGLQDYFANQMKPMWLLLQGLKRRQEKFQNQFNMTNQSFILE